MGVENIRGKGLHSGYSLRISRFAQYVNTNMISRVGFPCSKSGDGLQPALAGDLDGNIYCTYIKIIWYREVSFMAGQGMACFETRICGLNGDQ